jgi:hypothetical protein
VSTIASLIVEIAGDNSKLKKSLSNSKQLTQQYKDDIRNAQRDFAASAIRLREDLFRGALSPAEFARQGRDAGKSYNAAVLQSISDIRAAGQLTPRLHARLVTELREIGVEGGQAMGQGLGQGVEQTSAITSTIARRMQSTMVGVAFAAEAMANGSESGVRRALRAITLLAFAFGPEVGGIALAINTAGLAMYDFFNKTRKEAEKTMLEFRKHLAEMARAGPGGFIPAAELKTQIQSGDPFAAIEGKRKEETDREFEARRLGIVGITREISRLNALPAPKKTSGAFIAGGSEEVRKTRDRLVELGAELVTLKEQAAALDPVFRRALQAETDAAQNKLDTAARKQAIKDEKIDRVKLMEERLSQVLQTRDAMVKLGESTAAITDVTRGRLVEIMHDATAQLSAHMIAVAGAGKEYDKLSPKLKRTADELLHLEEIADKASDALIGTLKLSALKGPQLTATGAGVGVPDVLRTQPFTHEQIAARAAAGIQTIISGGAGATIGGPHVAALPTTGPGAVGPGVMQARIDAAQARFIETLGSVGSALKGWAGQLASFLNPVALIGRIFQQFAQSFVPVLEPLNQVFADLAAIVARDLAPVFKAFEPVLRALMPVIDEILRTLTPILVALAPMIQAFVPILKALFPILKAGAIVSTYLFQAFAIGASIFLRAVGNIIVGWGTIMKALATAIDKLPFVSAKGAIDAAQGIIDFGNALVESGGDFKKAADAMGKARDDIGKVTFDDTAGAVGKLGEAATEAADAMRNVPTWWKSSLAIFQATNARGATGAGISPNIPPNLTPGGIGSRLPVPTITSGTTGTGSALSAVAGNVTNVTIDKVEITDQLKSGKELVKEVIAEARRLSQATFGTTARWAEVV